MITQDMAKRYNLNKEELYSTFKGNITVEAAFLMPIILITLFALFYLTFYLHDRCAIQGKLDKALHRAGITVKHDADMATGRVDYENIGDRGVLYLLLGDTGNDETKVSEYLKQELSNGLFLFRITNITIAVDRFSISGVIEADCKISLAGAQFIKELFSQITIEDEYALHNPAEAIRGFEVVLDTGSQIKGVDKLRDTIQSFLNKIKNK